MPITLTHQLLKLEDLSQVIVGASSLNAPAFRTCPTFVVMLVPLNVKLTKLKKP